jgi:hypothetical protein
MEYLYLQLDQRFVSNSCGTGSVWLGACDARQSIGPVLWLRDGPLRFAILGLAESRYCRGLPALQ